MPWPNRTDLRRSAGAAVSGWLWVYQLPLQWWPMRSDCNGCRYFTETALFLWRFLLCHLPGAKFASQEFPVRSFRKLTDKLQLLRHFVRCNDRANVITYLASEVVRSLIAGFQSHECLNFI